MNIKNLDTGICLNIRLKKSYVYSYKLLMNENKIKNKFLVE